MNDKDLLTAQQASQLAGKNANGRYILYKVLKCIETNALKGLFSLAYQGSISEEIACELKKLGYNVYQSDDSAYEDFWYIQW